MDDLTPLEYAWLIWSDETGVDMDQAFANSSTPQQWCEAGIFPGDHELLMVQGYGPNDSQSNGFERGTLAESTVQPPYCARFRVWIAHCLIWCLRHLAPTSGIFRLFFGSGKYILSIGVARNAYRTRTHIPN